MTGTPSLSRWLNIHRSCFGVPLRPLDPSLSDLAGHDLAKWSAPALFQLLQMVSLRQALACLLGGMFRRLRRRIGIVKLMRLGLKGRLLSSVKPIHHKFRMQKVQLFLGLLDGQRPRLLDVGGGTGLSREFLSVYKQCKEVT